MPWLFVHIMKTAGTSFRSYMEHIAPEKVFPNRADLALNGGQYFGPKRFLAALDSGSIDPDQREFMFGHFPLWVMDEVPESWNIATVIREPVARSVSIIRGYRERQGLRHLSYEDLLGDDAFRTTMIENYQTKVLGAEKKALKSANGAMVCDQGTLERAKERISRVAFLGITESIPANLDEWHRVTGLPKKSSFPHLNRARPEPIGDELRESILPYVGLDKMLYEAVSDRSEAWHKLRAGFVDFH